MKVKSVSYGRTASKDFQSKRVDVTIVALDDAVKTSKVVR